MIVNSRQLKTFDARYHVRAHLLKRYSIHVISGRWTVAKYHAHVQALNSWTLRGTVR